MAGSILLVDDEQDTRELLTAGLRLRDLDVRAVDSAEACLASLRDHDIDIVITDLQMPGMGGVELVKQIQIRHPNILTVVLTGVATVESAIEAVRAGAYDYLTKPVTLDAIEIAVRRALDHAQTRQEARVLRRLVGQADPIPSLVGSSAPLRALSAEIRRVAESDATVLITGESGTGKELVARALHQLSARRSEPFVAINCGAMPEHLLESELFGHVRGAFTDAHNTRAGLFVQAGDGTLFLDEIGEMPLQMQVKLLRVLQERMLRPVGSDSEVPFHARIVTATNRDLEHEIEQRQFREDLYYRINVVALAVPSLRERGADVLELARHFAQRICARNGKPVPDIDALAARRLVDYAWPGNVRELENTVERALAIAGHGLITTAHLPPKIVNYTPQRLELSSEIDQMVTLDEMERRYVRQVLAAASGNKSQAAKILGIDRRSLYRRLEPPLAPPDPTPPRR